MCNVDIISEFGDPHSYPTQAQNSLPNPKALIWTQILGLLWP